MRIAILFLRASIAVFLLIALLRDAAPSRAEDTQAQSERGLEQRIVGVVDEMRRLCRGEAEFAVVGPHIRALVRDPRARALMRRYYYKDFDALIPIDLLLVAMEYDWQRKMFDEALRTAQAWQSDGAPLSYGMLLLSRILEYRAVAARGLSPPSPDWPVAWRIEQVQIEGMNDMLAVAWKRAECPGNGLSREMLVGLYAPDAASQRLHMLGAAAEADLPNALDYEGRFFEAIAFPDPHGIRHSYLIARLGIDAQGSATPASVELLAVDSGGLHRVEVERGDVLDHLEALSDDGRYQAIAYDRRWTRDCVAPPLGKIESGEHEGIMSCLGNPHAVPIVLDWHVGRLVEACRAFPEFYETAARALRQRPPLSPQLKREKETVFQRGMWDAFALFAVNMQQGKLDEALDRFDLTVDGAGFSEGELSRARNAARYLRAQVERQRPALERPCPMSAFTLE